MAARIDPTTPQTTPEDSKPLLERPAEGSWASKAFSNALAILARTEIDFPKAPRLPES